MYHGKLIQLNLGQVKVESIYSMREKGKNYIDDKGAPGCGGCQPYRRARCKGIATIRKSQEGTVLKPSGSGNADEFLCR